MTNIRLFDVLLDFEEVPCKQILMPGGEPYVEIHDDASGRLLLVDARVGSMDDWGILLATLDALHRLESTPGVVLFIPYFPGARGDRVNPGDGTALAAAMYARMLDPYDLQRVVILDPHSDVTPALLGPKVTVVPITAVLAGWSPGIAPPATVVMKYDALVCPDQGAEKRTALAAKTLGVSRVFSARKHRDPSTGALDGFRVDWPDDLMHTAPRVLIVDDICDGGGTFVGLAERIHEYNCPDAKIDLFVTHGIFSKGVDALVGIDRVYCTDSFPGRYRHPGERPIDGIVPLDTLYDIITERHT